MKTLFAVIGVFAISTAIAVLWVNGVDHMKDNHPDYKGDDFFDEDPTQES